MTCPSRLDISLFKAIPEEEDFVFEMEMLYFCCEIQNR
jgi:hypothetical protein